MSIDVKVARCMTCGIVYTHGDMRGFLNGEHCVFCSSTKIEIGKHDEIIKKEVPSMTEVISRRRGANVYPVLVKGYGGGHHINLNDKDECDFFKETGLIDTPFNNKVRGETEPEDIKEEDLK